MKATSFYFVILLLAATLFSCKNDVKETEEITETEPPVKKERIVLSEEEKEERNTIFLQLMATPETKTFASAMVSTGLAENVSNPQMAYTIFAPSNTAFEQLSQEKLKFLLNPAQKGDLTTLLKNHLVEETLNTEALTAAIKKNNGTYPIKTMGGETFTATLKGDYILIKDTAGAQATVSQTSLSGSNGVVYIMDAVLAVK